MQHHALLVISGMFLPLYLLTCIYFLKNIEEDATFVIFSYHVCCYPSALPYIFE